MQVEFYLAGEITQVKESIPWVRCASGNVSIKTSFLILHEIEQQWITLWERGYIIIDHESLAQRLTSQNTLLAHFECLLGSNLLTIN